MNLYRITTDSRDHPTVWIVATDPTAAQKKLCEMYVAEKYTYRPLALEIALIAGEGITGKPTILIV